MLSKKGHLGRFRAPRFRLRTLLAVFALACFVFSCVGYWMRLANQQRASVAWATAHGGVVYYDFKFDERGQLDVERKAPVPPWVIELLGIDFFSSPRWVFVDGPVRDLNGISNLKRLRRLHVYDGAGLADLQPLRAVTTIDTLSLCGTEVRDLRPLSHLTHLRDLIILESPVEDLRPLAGLYQLEGLGLGNSEVSDLAPLRNLPRLSGLDIRGTNVSDISPLAGITSLQMIFIQNTAVADLTPLAGLRKLQLLNASSSHVSDVRALAGLTELERIWLDDTDVSSIEELRQLPKLKLLSINNTLVPAEQVSDLRKRLPNCRILWSARL